MQEDGQVTQGIRKDTTVEGANGEAGTTQGAGEGVSQVVMREVTGASPEGFREEGAAPLAEVKVSTD